MFEMEEKWNRIYSLYFAGAVKRLSTNQTNAVLAVPKLKEAKRDFWKTTFCVAKTYVKKQYVIANKKVVLEGPHAGFSNLTLF